MCRCPARRRSVNWVEVDGEVVATDPDNGAIHVFRGATAAVWQLIDGAPIDGLPELVADTFDIDVEQARTDLSAALEQLSAVGVIECGCR